MKAIKDCVWRVHIQRYTPFFSWTTKTNNEFGLAGWPTSFGIYKTFSSAKRNWERFAKINGIKKWKYV